MTRILGQEGVYPRISGFLKGVRTVGVSFRVRGVVPDPLYVAGPGQIPSQGYATAHLEASKVTRGGAPSAGGSDGGNGLGRD